MILHDIYYSSGVLFLSSYEKYLKAFPRSRKRKTDAVIFTYGKHLKPTGVFKIKFKHKINQ